MWALLEEVVAIQREVLGRPWTNFEQLERDTRAWCEEHGISTAMARGLTEQIIEENRHLRHAPDPTEAQAPAIVP
jgi:hypothetical protein